MISALIGRKLGMTGLFTSDGQHIPVTVIQAGPCVVTQIKRADTEGYSALQLGFGDKKSSRVNKPMKGHFKKSGERLFETLKEFRVDNPDDFEIGQEITLGQFAVGERVHVTGTTKGRGFAGTIKRHGFSRGPITHGSKSVRIPGSIGCSATPSKVIKGKKMPGQYGNARQTTKNLEIIDIREDQHLLMIKGAVPGSKSSLVMIQKSAYTK
ncbi:LSU ribosomal protein L3p (L3e) [Olavius algarvensis associated proteobacterium Delta 3]|nr:LSU ribosomal protein L3p (L3e) [Olavius algarvensis associated proteobacterium Delta 3]